MAKGRKILIAEDELVFQKLYGGALEGAGFDVTYCNNGEEAEKKLSKNTYDLAILDIIMPFMSGSSLLQKLKKKKQKVIVLSTLTGNTDKQDALNAGAAKYLEKQKTSPEDLLKIVKGLTK